MPVFHLVNVRDASQECFVDAASAVDARNQANSDPGPNGPIWSDPSKTSCVLVQSPDSAVPDAKAVIEAGPEPIISPDAPLADSITEQGGTPAASGGTAVETDVLPLADVPVPGVPVHVDSGSPDDPSAAGGGN